MPRIPPIDVNAAHEDVRKLLELQPTHAQVLGTVAHAETLLGPFMQMAGAFLQKLDLPHELRELVILRVAHMLGCEYEWAQHVPIARSLGFSEERIEGVRSGADSGLFDKVECAVLRFTDDALRNTSASDATFYAVEKHLGHRALVEITLAIGFYQMLARLLETAEVTVEEPSDSFVQAVTRESTAAKSGPGSH